MSSLLERADSDGFFDAVETHEEWEGPRPMLDFFLALSMPGLCEGCYLSWFRGRYSRPRPSRSASKEGLGSVSEGARPLLEDSSPTRSQRIDGKSLRKAPLGEAFVAGQPSWSPSDASTFKVRVGPDYPQNRTKAPSAPALYNCVGVDIVRGARRLDKVVPRLVPLPPGGTGWSRECRVPRVFIYNVQLTDEPPPLFGPHPESDSGVSVVCHFVASPDLIEISRRDSRNEALPPELKARLPAVRLLQELFERKTLKPKDTTGVAKIITLVDNVEGLDLGWAFSSLVKRYVGLPVCTTEADSRIYVDPDGEWMEIDTDIRQWSVLSRKSLYNNRGMMPRVSAQLGLVLQGVADEELPEVMLACTRFNAVGLDECAIEVDEPQSPNGFLAV